MDKIDFVNAQKPALNDENLNKMQDNIERAINAQVSGDTLPIGSIIPYSSDNAPENWLLANGQAVSRTEYNHLFAIISTTYGEGDGSTTFNLPNLCGRVVVGQDENDSDFDEVGKTGGEKKHTLTIEEMPSHKPTTEDGEAIACAKYAWNSTGDNFKIGNEGGYEIKQLGIIGGDKAHNNVQPYIVQNYIIKAKQSAGIVATVVDSLESESETDALSAKQGKLLSEKIEGVEVFNGSTKENVTLNTSVSNAKHMEIYFKDQENNYGYVTVDSPAGKKVILNIIATNAEQSGMWIKTRHITINDKLLTNNYCAEMNNNGAVSANNFIYITKVIAYF